MGTGMLIERIEEKWIAAFARVLELSQLKPGEIVAILSETQSRPVNVQLAELAALRLGARAFHIVVPTPRQTAPVPVRSTGASDAVQHLAPVVSALAGSQLVMDLTVEGMLHAPELPEILGGGARLVMVSNEHPEALERLLPDPALEAKVKVGMKKLRSAATMRVTSAAGTDLTIRTSGAPVGGVWGYAAKPGQVAHWPGGLCLCFPKAGTVNGTLVLAPGDANLPFKRYVERPITLRLADDYVIAIQGAGLHAALSRSYIAA